MRPTVLVICALGFLLPLPGRAQDDPATPGFDPVGTYHYVMEWRSIRTEGSFTIAEIAGAYHGRMDDETLLVSVTMENGTLRFVARRPNAAQDVARTAAAEPTLPGWLTIELTLEDGRLVGTVFAEGRTGRIEATQVTTAVTGISPAER